MWLIFVHAPSPPCYSSWNGGAVRSLGQWGKGRPDSDGRFNAIVKNLVNAGATFATYFLSLLLFGTQFNVTKFGLVLCVIQGIYQYAG